jgi:RHS repeat-associated protein
VAQFNYDSFGNLRNASGTGAFLPGNAGGDFRFQGQWLDEATGLYNFRARYYDPETGRFMSYDPIELIDMEPESSNPYQFVYNNPHVYSDPTGMFSIIELNTTLNLQDTLRSIAGEQARQYLQENVKRVFSDIAIGVINRILPGNPLADRLDSMISKGPDLAGGGFENFIKGAVCSSLPSTFNNWLWLTPEVNVDGRVKSPGFNCGNESSLPSSPISNPEFIIQKEPPTKNRKFDYDSHLIGDVKVTAEAALADVKNNDRQWQAMFNHARSYQSLDFATYITFKSARKNSSNPDIIRAELMQAGVKKGVILVLARIFE